MYDAFSLVLMVTHACNLRCRYCYTGAKFRRTMSEATGLAGIARAVASTRAGGRLHLGFFGGEPLLEAALIERLVGEARRRCRLQDLQLELDVTTNGTLLEDDAWSVLTASDMSVSVSCDGRPTIHDRYRRTTGDDGSSSKTVETIRRLVDRDKPFRVVMVLRPDTVVSLVEGLEYFQSLGVSSVVPSLDLWCTWDAYAIAPSSDPSPRPASCGARHGLRFTWAGSTRSSPNSCVRLSRNRFLVVVLGPVR